MGEIDWTVELKKIEREFDGLPPAPSPATIRARREADQTAERRKRERDAVVGASLRLSLVLALGIAIIFWPFVRACGSGLMSYLGATAVIAFGGLWSCIWTWRARMAMAHALAMVSLIWGLALASAEVLPRMGYAKPDPKHPTMLWCPGSDPSALYTRWRAR